MVFICSKCNKIFDQRHQLTNHLKKKIPCDYVCVNCGEALSHSMAYKRHMDSNNCAPIDYSEEQIQQKLNATKAKSKLNVQNSNNNSNNNTNCNNNSNNQYNYLTLNGNINITMTNPETIRTTNVRKLGLYAHEDEALDHVYIFAKPMQIIFMDFIDQHILLDKIPDENLYKLMLVLAQLFHSNVDAPEYMNIMDDNAESKHNKIYSGKKFIDDIMTKDIRNKRIIQRVLDKVKKYIKLQNVPESIVKFCEETFIFYLVELYVKCEHHEELQKTWQTNKQYLDKIDLKTVPASNGRHLTKNDLWRQCESMMEKRIYMHQDYLRLTHEKTAQNLIDIANNYISDKNE